MRGLRVTLAIVLLGLATASSLATAAEEVGFGRSAGRAACRAALRQGRITGESFLPLRGTPLPRWLRRVGHPARALAGRMLLRPGDDQGPLQVKLWSSGFSIDHNGTLFRLSEPSEGVFAHLINDWPPGAPGDMRFVRAVSVRDGRGKVMAQNEDGRQRGGVRTRNVEAFEVQRDVELPGARQVPRGSWVVSRARSTAPTRYALWRWEAGPGSRRVSEPLSQAEFETVTGAPAP